MPERTVYTDGNRTIDDNSGVYAVLSMTNSPIGNVYAAKQPSFSAMLDAIAPY